MEKNKSKNKKKLEDVKDLLKHKNKEEDTESCSHISVKGSDDDLLLKEDGNINLKKEKKEKSKEKSKQKEKKFKKTETTEDSDETKTTVFISGIPYDTTEEEIKKMFSKYGKIVLIKIPRYQDSGKNRGYGHITYNHHKEAEEAVKNNKKVFIGKRYLVIEISRGENIYERKIDMMEKPEGCTTIMVKNLPYDISENDLAQKFKPCGEIQSIRMVFHSKLGHFKGFAFIDFKNTSSVDIALHLHNKEINGRKMLVDFEDAKPKQGFKFRSALPSKFNKEYREVLNKASSKKKLK